MKFLITVLASILCFAGNAHSAANCAHSHSWQCQGHLANSGGNSQTGSGISTTGATTNPDTTNPHLGSTTPSQPMMTLTPAQGPATSGQGQVPTLPAMVVPPKPGAPKAPPIVNPIKVPDIAVKPIKSPTLTGTSQRPSPQITPIKAPPIVGYGKVPQATPKLTPPIVNPQKTPNLVVSPIQSPSFTGTSPVQTIKPTKAPPLTGYGKVPQVAPILVPPVTNPAKAPPIVVNTIAVPPLTGYGKIPPQPVTSIPTPVITGQGKVPSPKPIATPTLPTTGYAAVPNKPTIKIPPKQAVTAPPKISYLIPPQPMTPGRPTLKPQVVAIPVKAQQNKPMTNTSTNKPALQKPLAKPVLAQNKPNTHYLINNQRNTTVKELQIGAASKQTNVVEPGIQNQSVALYRSNDATEEIYGDIIPMDKTGFFLSVVGIKEPHFNNPRTNFPETDSNEYFFFFDYASSHIYQEQAYQFDQIVAHHQKTGKRVIIMGETDGFGSQDYNTHLAIHRSNQIIDTLITKGIPAESIEFKVWVRCCRIEQATAQAIAATEDQRVTWVTFE